MNANGYILGCSGSGKSMFSKAEMFDVLLKYPNDEIIVIDPENEYKLLVKYFDGSILKLSPSSPTKLNIFDIDLTVSEEGTSAIAMKSETIMTIVETAKGQELTSNEITIIDRCVKLAYQSIFRQMEMSDFFQPLRIFINFYYLHQSLKHAHLLLHLRFMLKVHSISFPAKQILIQISVLWYLILPKWVNKFVL